jgi:DNA-binding MarR family transcriptional regulator
MYNRGMVEKRAGHIQHIGEIIRERNIVLKGADVLTAQGFTQVPNHVLKSEKVSPGAKLAYAMLLSYAWQNDYCFPGQERLAKDMGSGVRSVVRYIQELEQNDFLSVRRQGQGRPNLYELNLTAKGKRKANPEVPKWHS